MSKTDYLREARRVRTVYARRPAEMHARLRQLGNRRDQQVTAKSDNSNVEQVSPRKTSVRKTSVRRVNTPAQPPHPTSDFVAVPANTSVLGITAPTAETFAQLVEQSIEAGRLRFTARERLLAEADRLKIGRFDANLIIASVVHAKGENRTEEDTSSVWGIAATICCGIAAMLMMAWSAGHL